MKRARFDKSLPTIPGGSRQVSVSQARLDDLIRKVAQREGCAVEDMVRETAESQVYQLSDGRLLTIWKGTGEIKVGCTSNR